MSSSDEASDDEQTVRKAQNKTATKRPQPGKEKAEANAKKAKTGNGDGEQKTDQDGNLMLDLGKMKFAVVRQFRNETYVDVREFYTDRESGATKPGKKGISLTLAQWDVLKSFNDKIDELIAAKKG